MNDNDLTDEYLDALQQALMSGEQADMDGCRVKVSRQACEEAAATIAVLRQREAKALPEIAALVEAYEALLKDLTDHGGYTYEDDFTADLAAIAAIKEPKP